MSFLSPLFLLGGLAVALPVVFHLIRRTTRHRTVFSSLLFLQPTPPRLTRRSRLEHLLLLALRCGAICLLALGFSRPFFKKPLGIVPPADSGRRIFVLLDTSASMRRSGLWSDACADVDSLLRSAKPGDQIAVSTFDQQLTPLIDFEQWNSIPAGERPAAVIGKLAAIKPGWSSTRLGSALIAAAEALSDTGAKSVNGPGEIVLVSDLQEGARLEGLQGFDWPRDISVTVQPVIPKQPGNAGLHLLPDLDNAASAGPPSMRVRVSNSSDAKQEQFKVGWVLPNNGSHDSKPTDLYVPAGQSRDLSLPLPTPGGSFNQLTLRGDTEDFDNTAFVIPPEQTRVQLLYFGSETEADTKKPFYFLQRAFQETRLQQVRVSLRSPTTPIPPADAASAGLFFIAAPLAEDNARLLRNQLQHGKTALLCLQSEAEAPTIAALLSLDRLSVEEAHPNNYAMLAEIDFRHPLFAAFNDPRFSDFSKIHFWNYRRLDAAALPGARTLAKFDGGDPALLEIPTGQGRLLVLACGWQPEDSQLALSTKFVPLLYSLLDFCRVTSPAPEQYLVGQSVSLQPPSDASAGPLVIRAPDGSEISLGPNETNFTKTSQPGIYTIASPTSSRQFAVNLDPAESRTAPLQVDELERLGVPLSHRSQAFAAHEAARKVQLQNAELEGRQKLWRWLIALTLGILLVETLLAGWTARRVPIGS
jgi:hypothetical protein